MSILVDSEPATTDVLNDLNAAAAFYITIAKGRRPSEQLVKKARRCQKEKCLEAVLFDKGFGYCNMDQINYRTEPKISLQSPYFMLYGSNVVTKLRLLRKGGKVQQRSFSA